MPLMLLDEWTAEICLAKALRLGSKMDYIHENAGKFVKTSHGNQYLYQTRILSYCETQSKGTKLARKISKMLNVSAKVVIGAHGVAKAGNGLTIANWTTAIMSEMQSKLRSGLSKDQRGKIEKNLKKLMALMKKEYRAVQMITPVFSSQTDGKYYEKSTIIVGNSDLSISTQMIKGAEKRKYVENPFSTIQNSWGLDELHGYKFIVNTPALGITIRGPGSLKKGGPLNLDWKSKSGWTDHSALKKRKQANFAKKTTDTSESS